MTVLQVAYSLAPVGPVSVGGAEEVLSALDRALVARGHRSLVVACQGSDPAGELFAAPLPAEPLSELSSAAQRAMRDGFQAALNRALRSTRVDLVHMHGLDFAQYRLPGDIPVLVTLHMPIGWYAERHPGLWRSLGPNVHLQCVSEQQWRSCARDLNPVAVVGNGVPLPLSPPPELAAEDEALPAQFALVLGRICPEKNAADALRAGTLAGLPVLIGGDVFPYKAHQCYFREEIAPLLQAHNGPSHRFLGPLCPERRLALLARARCLLHPTLAPETSSLVAMEALAAGTPVIAYPSGALPEIVEHGRTGFLVDSPKAMAQAIPLASTLSREECRAVARDRFSRERMIARYLALYGNLLRKQRSRSEAAVTSHFVELIHG